MLWVSFFGFQENTLTQMIQNTWVFSFEFWDEGGGGTQRLRGRLREIGSRQVSGLFKYVLRVCNSWRGWRRHRVFVFEDTRGCLQGCACYWGHLGDEPGFEGAIELAHIRLVSQPVNPHVCQHVCTMIYQHTHTQTPIYTRQNTTHSNSPFSTHAHLKDFTDC